MRDLVWTFERLAWRMPRDLFARQAVQFRGVWRALTPNGRALVGFNICWTLPLAFAGIYLQIFMREQGLTEIEIGSVVSAQLAVQVTAALLAGWSAERMGRLRTVTWADLLCWPMAFACYALSDGYLLFAAGAMFAGGIALLIPSWNSLYIEGTSPRIRVHMFGLLQIPWFVGSILASLSGPLVARYGVTETCRAVFSAGVASALLGWWVRGRFLTDTDTHLKPVRPSWNEARRFLGGYWLALRAVVRRRGLLLALLMQVAFQAGLVVAGTYTYLTDPSGVAIPKAELSILPLLGGTTVLLATFLVVPGITLTGLPRAFFAGLGLMSVNVLLLIFAPRGSLPVVMAAALLGSAGFAVFNPSVNGFWTNQMTDAERGRLDGFRWVVTMLVNIPVPLFAGALYKGVHPRMPLVLLLGYYAIIAALGIAAFRLTVPRLRARTS